MDQMSELKLKMNILQGLIEADKSTSKTREDKLSLLREQMLVSKMRDNIASPLREKYWQPRAQSIAHQDITKTNPIMIQMYTIMRIQYIALQDEYLALAKCTTGDLKL